MAEPTAVAADEVTRFASDLIRFDTTNRGGGDCSERTAAEYVAEVLADSGLSPVLLESACGRSKSGLPVGSANCPALARPTI